MPDQTRKLEVVRTGSPGEFLVREGDGVTQAYAIAQGATTWVFHDGTVYEIAAESPGKKRQGAHVRSELTAPMPATVVAVKVAPGDAVKKGDILIVLEAMKMELPVRAPGDARVAAVHCRPGDLVQPDRSLIDLE